MVHTQEHASNYPDLRLFNYFYRYATYNRDELLISIAVYIYLLLIDENYLLLPNIGSMGSMGSMGSPVAWVAGLTPDSCGTGTGVRSERQATYNRDE